MVAKLRERTAPSLTRLRWLEPVHSSEECGHQCAAGTDYVIRKTPMQDKTMYWAWFGRKLLGYNTNLTQLRELCEAHAKESDHG